MFHMTKHSSIQSIFCDFRHATTSSLGVHSRSSLFMRRLVSYLPKINHEMCHKSVNLNLLEINHDHFPSMSSPNFPLSGGSLGYWTACNSVKRYCTLPYCDITADRRPVYPVSKLVAFCYGFGIPPFYPFPSESFSGTGVLCKIWYPSETHLNLKTHEILFVDNIDFICPICKSPTW